MPQNILLNPTIKNADLPFVFCGINWSAEDYGFPTKNITGMLEVTPYRHTLSLLSKHAKGSRIGYIGGNTLTSKKNISYLENKGRLVFEDGMLVDTYEEFKKAYSRLQGSVDMLIFLSPEGIKGWESAQARAFIVETMRIPSGAFAEFVMPYCVVGTVDIAQEQGYWSGKTALKILEGKSPASIPIEYNRQTRLWLNMPMAKKLGITFSMDTIKNATLISE